MAIARVHTGVRSVAARTLRGLWLLASLLLPLAVSAQTYPTPLSNTGTVTAPADVGDPTPGNNSATDSNVPALQAQLSVTKTVTSPVPAPVGSIVQYRIQVGNAGPSNAIDVGVVDSVPVQLSNVDWVCTASGAGSSCGQAAGSGNAINLAVDVGVGGNVVIVVSGTAPGVTPATIAANTVSLVLPPGTTDPTPADNTATTSPLAVQPLLLVANEDTFATPISSLAGGSTTTVLSNDTLDGGPVVAGNLQIQLTAAPAGYTIDPAGVIVVPAGAPAGAAQVTYRICETASPANCASAVAHLVVGPRASDDSFNVNGGASTFTGNLALNDNAPAGALYSLVGAPVPGLTIASTGGSFTYAPAGGINAARTFQYQVCLPAPDSGVCAVATAHIVLDANPIVALDDGFAAIMAGTGGTTATGVLANDSFAGGSVPLAGQVQVSLVGAPAGFSIDLAGNGTISVQQGTPAGVYALTYRICEAAFPDNCATATARLPVGPDAVDEQLTTPGGGRALTGSVAVNDNAVPGSGYALAVSGDPANGSVVLDGNGTFTYTPGTHFTGDDAFIYRVCLPSPDTAVCDTATARIVVAANTVDAVDDLFTTVIPPTGGETPSLLANDSLNGSPFPQALATITLDGAPAGISIGAGGVLVVDAGAPTGAASFSYKLCQGMSCDTAGIELIVAPEAAADAYAATGGVLLQGDVADNDRAPSGAVFSPLTSPNLGSLVFEPSGRFNYTPLAGTVGIDTFDYQVCLPAPHASVCAPGTATINVAAAPINAVDDPFGGTPVGPGGTTDSVLGNDTLNGVPVAPAQVAFNLINGAPVGYALNAAGQIVVPSGAAAGPVALSYELCEAGTGNCDTATVTLLVAPVAVDDAFSTVAGRALSNSVAINDNAPAGATFSIPGSTPVGLLINGNGSFDFTPADGFTGSVPFTYQVCLPAPDNLVCATAQAIITVDAGTLTASDDDFRGVVINPVNGGTTASVLANDGHNGAVPPAPGDVILGLVGAPAGFSINPNGTISIAGGSGAGAASFGYRMCEAVLPGNCVEADVQVLLGPVAAGDTLSTPVGQAVSGHVAGNDTVAAGATFAVTSATPAGLVFDADGSFTYTPPPGTSGVVDFTYQVCLPAPDEAVCSSAGVTINVNAGNLVAIDDDLRAGLIDPLVGGTTASVLGNDSLNGTTPPAPASVLLTLLSAPTGFQLASDGTLEVPAGSRAGAVTVVYQLCEAALAANCATAQASLLIAPEALDDALSTPVGQPVAGNLFSNDNAPAGSVYGVVGPAPDGLNLGADGSLIYTPPVGTSGPVGFTYQVCLPAPNASTCATAAVTINVNAGTLLAVADDFSVTAIDPATGGSTDSVLGNDALNGITPPLPATVQLSLVGPPAGFGINPDGTLSVAANAPAGRTALTYQVCEAALPGNCATAAAAVLVAPLAVPDAFTALAGVAYVANVATNDNAPAGARFVVTGAAPDGLVFNGDGTFVYTSPDGVSGPVAFTYQVCLPVPFDASCSTAGATIQVDAGALLAGDDDLRATPIDPVTGGTTPSVLGNDSLNGVSPPAPSSVVLRLNAPPAGISFGAAGAIHVAPGTVAGAVTLTYSLCEAVLPTNCVTATVQLLLSPVAVDDLLSTPVGQALTGSVAGNDNLPVGAVFAVDGPSPNGLAFDAAGGFTYTPPPGTSGPVTFAYRACLPVPDAAVCDTASVTINVNAGTLAAAADDFSAAPIDPASGGVTASVLLNDALSGTTPPLPATVLLSLVGAPTGYAIAADGTVSVPANAAAGRGTLTYQICEAALPGNCDSSSVTLVVSPAANDDVVATRVGQTVAGNVATNDNVPLDAVFAVSGVAPPGLAFNPDGSFTFTPPLGSSGPVSFDYQVCLAAPDAGVCDAATATINVNAGTLSAADDDFSGAAIDPVLGGSTASVLANDTLNGSTPPLPASVQLSLVGAPAGVAINSDGTLGIAAGAAAGGFDLTYQICEAALSSNCDNALVRLVIAPDAVDDVLSTPVGQALSGTVAGNDNVPATALFTLTGGMPAGLVFNPNGSFTYTPPAGSSGPVGFTYRVCLAAPDAAVCDTAAVSIDVSAGSIIANDDSFAAFPIDPVVGGSTASVLANDGLNAATPPRPQDVVLSLVGAPPGVSIDASGTMTVAPGTTAGALDIGYTLCEAALVSNCDTATAVVVVAPAAVDDVVSTPVGQSLTGAVGGNDNVPAGALFSSIGPEPAGLVLASDGSFNFIPPAGSSGPVGFTYQVCLPAPYTGVCDTASVTINVNAGTLGAADDDFSATPIDPATGGTTASVLANDSLDGTTPPLPASVQLSLVGAPGGYAINAAGTVVVPAGAAAGAVTLTYQVCETALPTNCSTAGIGLVVRPAANDDVVSTPVGRLVTGNVALNDNAPVTAVFAVSGTTPPGLTFNADGSFSYTPPAGSSGPVTFSYEVCLPAPDVDVCAAASATINVNPGTLVAVADDFSTAPIDPATGGVTASVLDNDTLNGTTPPLPASVLLSLVGAPTGYAISADGMVGVPANAAAGTIALTYQVCETALPSNCDSAGIRLVVAPRAVDDVVSTRVGVPLTGHVGTNDNAPVGAVFTVDGPTPPGLVLAGNGSFTYTPPAGSSGAVDFAYRVCLPAPSAGVCDTAGVTIDVDAGTLIASTDDFSDTPIDPATGGVTASVLANDSLNGTLAPPAASVQLSLVAAPSGYSINADGTVVVPAGLPAGSTTLTYRICEAALTTNCDDAAVTFVIAPVAVDDAVSTPVGLALTGDAGTNDNVPPGAVFSVSGATPPGLVFNPDGGFSYTAPLGTTGPVVFTYQVCLPAPDAAVCDTASVTIDITGANIAAVADTFTTAIVPGTTGTETVLSNDTLNGATPPLQADVILSLVGAPAGYAITAAGQVTVPTGAISGAITLTYRICEAAASGNCSSADIALVVAPAPADDVVSTTPGIPVSGDVGSNDNVPAGSEFVLPGGAIAGLVFNTDGSFVYTPQPAVPGPVVFNYRVCLPAPNDGVCGNASATINIGAGNLLATADTFSTPIVPGTTGTETVLSNDTLDAVTPPAQGDVILSLVGAPAGYAITPAGQVTVSTGVMSGAITLTYQICEAAASTNCSSADIALVVAPAPADDVVSTTPGIPVSGDVGSNDNVPAGSRFVLQGGAVAGLVFNTDGSFVYTPQPGAHGPVVFSYRVCLPAPNDGVCENAGVSIGITAANIAAVADTFTTAIVPGTTGAETVLSNDTLNGATPPLQADVILSLVGAPAGYAITPAGQVTVSTGVTSGATTLTYRICEAAASSNCASATVSLVVTPAPADDVVPVAIGVQETGDLGANDNVPPGSGFTVVGAAPTGLTLDPDGTFAYTAPPGAPGTVLLTYQVCLPAPNGSLCGTATATFNVAGGINILEAFDDDFTAIAINPATGGTTASVLQNDRFNATTPPPANSVLPSLVGPPAGILMAPNGTISVAAGTPAGQLTLSYRICDATEPGNCADAQVTLLVQSPAGALVAFNDTASAVSGATDVINVLENDTYSGVRLDPALVVFTPVPTAAVSFSAAGGLNVAAGLAPGVYTTTYTICLVAQPAVCATAAVSVTVTPAPGGLVAVADTVLSVPTTGGANVTNVLANDTFGGAPLDPSTVTFTPAGTPALAFDAAGNVSVAAGLLPGPYTTTYTICLVAQPAVCATGTVSVTVTAVSAALVAAADAVASVPTTGASNVINVLANDTFNGAPLDPSSVTFTPAGTPALAFDAAGNVSVAAGLLPGPYTTTYTICLVAQPAVCATGSVSVTVVGINIVLAANDDFRALPINPATGGATSSVLGNDRFNGVAPPPAGVIVANLVGPPAGFSLSATGAILVSPGTPPGTYPVTYRICESAAPGNCSQAVATVAVQAPTGTLVAFDDVVASVPATGGSNVINVLANDASNGAALVPSAVMFMPVTTSALGFDAAGNVTVAAGLAPGVYTTTYTICLVAQPTVCATGTVRVTVVGANAILAVDDAFGALPINPVTGGATPSVLGNDQLNGVAPLSSGSVVLSLVGAPPGFSVSGTGAILVPAGTAPGIYRVTYRICERAAPANCSQAVATLTVQAQAGALVAFDDVLASVPTAGGGDVLNVLANDTSNGTALDASTVLFTPVATAALTFDAAGNLSVARGLDPGVYTTTYTLCLIARPAVCSTATVRVTVVAEVIEATDDGWVLPSNADIEVDVLANDRENGRPIDPAAIVVSIASPLPYGTATVMSGARIRIALATWFSGIQSFDYRICVVTDPDDCATATVTIEVAANVLGVSDDAVVAGETGEVAIDVLANDSMRTAPLDPSSLRIVVAPANGTVTCNGGMCIYRALRAFGGADSFRYRICDVSVPTPACAEATVLIDTVGAQPAVLRLTKTAATRSARIGDLVRYTVAIENVGGIDAREVSLIDTLPPGFVFVRGGFEVRDADNAARAGGVQPLRIDGIDVAAGDSASLVYYLRVGAGTGTGLHTNRITAVDAQGRSIANVASADVEITADPLIEESLLVGSVFDDRNGNGRQDPGERGIPGVRVAAVEGLLMETDAYGRYHLLGIPGGGARGRNFILKVDPATLPAGAVFTTPNPLVRRITPGVPVRFDFGARLPAGGMLPANASRAADIELATGLFEEGSAEIPARHADVLARAAAALSSRGGGRVWLPVDDGGEALALQRAEAVRKVLRGQVSGLSAGSTRIELIGADGSVRAVLPLAERTPVDAAPERREQDRPQRTEVE